MSGLYQIEYEWAITHPKISEAQTLIHLAEMYSRFPNGTCLGLIEGCVDRIRELRDFRLWREQDSLF